MSKEKNGKVLYITPKKDAVTASREIVGRLSALSGSQALNTVLDHNNPGELVKSMTKVDLFWLIKKVGEDDALPLLSLASAEQWQYIMDMEIWERDTLNMPVAFQWLNRLQKADPERLPEFLYGDDGSLLSHLFFSKIIDLKIKDNDDFVPPEGYVTFDNLFYIKILAGEQSQDVEAILKNMALLDHNRFQALILGIQGSIPAEIEEEMYRLKSLRLAEEGYLPFDEAAEIYAYLKSDILKKDSSEYILNIPEDDESRALVPITPFITARADDLFALAAGGIGDHLVLDRLRLEFGGLCNRILSADRIKFESVDDLIGVCRKAGGYINIGLEKMSKGNRGIAEEFLKNHPLTILFRAGFSQALELKWQAKRWLQSSWFAKKGLDPDFWGNVPGGALKGVLLEKPLYYSEQKERDPFRDFESLDEIIETKTILDQLDLLDRLADNLIGEKKLPDPEAAGRKDITIYSLLITFWIKKIMGLPEDFMPLSLKDAKQAFEKLREGEISSPYKMSGYKMLFIEFFRSFSFLEEKYRSGFVSETIFQLWNRFADEYSMIDTPDLDPKYSKYLLII